jgi:hypothetical protein
VEHPATHEPARRFTSVHERLFHLFVVSHDLSHFEHVHPTQTRDGAFEVDLTLPRPGGYQLYADFLPENGTPQLLQQALFTARAPEDPAAGLVRLRPELGDQSDRGIRVKIEVPDGRGLIAGRPEMFRLSLRDAQSGRPVTDLEPFLGAVAHGFMVSQNLADALHVHPMEEFSRPNGPHVVFQTIFPRPGMYRLWVQFQRQGDVATVAFTIPVAAEQ